VGTGHISSRGAWTGQYLFSRMRDQSIFIISGKGWPVFCDGGNVHDFGHGQALRSEPHVHASTCFE